MDPTAFLKRGRVQPGQLEQLILTVVRGSRHIETSTEIPDISGVPSA
jgi:hypothetical protein